MSTVKPQAQAEPETQPQRAPLTGHGQTIHVIVVNFHHAELTARAVESALKSSGVELRVIVIDNDSDGTLKQQPALRDPRVEIIANDENLGFGAACNQGFEAALGDGERCAGVLLLHHAATLEPEALARLKAAGAEYGLAAPKITFADGSIYAAGGSLCVWRALSLNRGFGQADRGQYDEARTLRFAPACVLYLSAAALRGGLRFHEPFFLFYEDADLSLRLAKAGYETRYVPQARARFLGRSSLITRHENPALSYYDLRNRFLLLRRNASAPARWAGEIYLLCVALGRWGWLSMKKQSRPRAAALRQALADAFQRRFGAQE